VSGNLIHSCKCACTGGWETEHINLDVEMTVVSC